MPNFGGGLFKCLRQKKNIFLFITLILLIGLIGIGASYAYWRYTYKQNDFNTLGVSCFEVTLTNEENNIQLESVVPITDEEGLLLTPYTFTITNTCNTYAYYGVNLEDINSQDIEKRLSYQYIKASLDGSTPHNLTFYKETEPTIENADKAFQLTSGTLAPAGTEGDTRTYALRLWMDYDTPALSETMNATFLSKISIVASYMEQERIENNIVMSYESKTEGYSNISETVEITATSENYNIIEISEDGNTFTSIQPTKELIVTKEYTEEKEQKFYVRDEVGNIKELMIELQHLDQTGPTITTTPQEEWGSSNTISIILEDLKSGLAGYQITETEEEPTEWKDTSGTSVTKEEIVTENKDYYIWSKDALGNISHEKVTISKIDNIAPTSSFTTSTTGGSISIDASASYDNETEIVKYEYKIDNGSYYPSETSSYTFTGLSHGTHTVTVRVTDEAGNQNETSQTVNVVILFTVTYNANGGSGAPASQTKTYGVNLTLSSTKPTRTGYTFLGWSTSSNSTSATYSAGGTFTSNANTTLYAVWKANTYTITYNANGGSGAPASQTKTHGVNLTLSSTKPTRSNYIFLGWSTSSTGNVVYSAGSTYTGNSNVTLYAVWGLNYVYNSGNQYTSNTGGWTYTRTFFTQGGSVTSAANDSASFASSYMQWQELGTHGDAINYYGAGYFQNRNLINMSSAKNLIFQYTVPIATSSVVNGIKYYPSVTFSVLNSSGASLGEVTKQFSGSLSNIQTVSIPVSNINMSSIRIRISCTTTSTGNLTMQFRLYSIYATY